MTGSRSLTFSTTRRPTRRRWLRALLWIVGVVVVVAVLAAATGAVLWTYAWVRLGGTDVPSLAADGDDALGGGRATSPDGTTTVLVALTDPAAAAGSPPALVGPVALVQVGGARGSDAVVLTLPPELPVSVPSAGRMPLQQVFAEGGADRLLRTVVDYTEVRVDHVVAVGADALPDLVDALGPLEVCDDDTCRTVDREAAAASVEAYTDEPVAGTPEVAAILRALGAAVDAGSTITSPFATRAAIDVVGSQVTTDVGLRGAGLLPLAGDLAAAGEVAVLTLPGVRNPDSDELLILPEQAATRFALLREGGAPDRAASDAAATLLADTTVAVQNGTGTAGYAAVLGDQLTALGVEVVGTENAASFDRERTQVHYDQGDPAAEAAAVLVAAELEGAELVGLDQAPSFEGETVTVVVVGGSDLDSGAPDQPED
ncbi:MAG: LCP family protein [Nitriliruptor sp.]